MPPLKPETRWSATLVQTCSVIGAVTIAVWFIRGEFEAIRSDMKANRDTLARMEEFMRSEVVTQTQAERYAAAFQWENRSLPLIVPEVKSYRN